MNFTPSNDSVANHKAANVGNKNSRPSPLNCQDYQHPPHDSYSAPTTSTYTYGNHTSNTSDYSKYQDNKPLLNSAQFNNNTYFCETAPISPHYDHQTAAYDYSCRVQVLEGPYACLFECYLEINKTEPLTNTFQKILDGNNILPNFYNTNDLLVSVHLMSNNDGRWYTPTKGIHTTLENYEVLRVVAIRFVIESQQEVNLYDINNQPALAPHSYYDKLSHSPVMQTHQANPPLKPEHEPEHSYDLGSITTKSLNSFSRANIKHPFPETQEKYSKVNSDYIHLCHDLDELLLSSGIDWNSESSSQADPDNSPFKVVSKALFYIDPHLSKMENRGHKLPVFFQQMKNYKNKVRYTSEIISGTSRKHRMCREHLSSHIKLLRGVVQLNERDCSQNEQKVYQYILQLSNVMDAHRIYLERVNQNMRSIHNKAEPKSTSAAKEQATSIKIIEPKYESFGGSVFVEPEYQMLNEYMFKNATNYQPVLINNFLPRASRNKHVDEYSQINYIKNLSLGMSVAFCQFQNSLHCLKKSSIDPFNCYIWKVPQKQENISKQLMDYALSAVLGMQKSINAEAGPNNALRVSTDTRPNTYDPKNMTFSPITPSPVDSCGFKESSETIRDNAQFDQVSNSQAEKEPIVAINDQEYHRSYRSRKSTRN